MDAVIRLQNVTKLYGSQAALDHVTLEVPAGVVCALLGENGAGKTTAIKILLGLTDADAGKANVLGIDARSMARLFAAVSGTCRSGLRCTNG